MSGVELIHDLRNQLGEAPLWDAREQTLYWVDIDDPAIFRYRPAAGELDHFPVSIPVTALGLREAGGLVVASRDGFGFWDPMSGSGPGNRAGVTPAPWSLQ